jgi:predicted acetyltransferase
VAWLWQAFRNDLAPVVNGLPYADGRYRHDRLEEYPGPEREGWLAWALHPNTGEPAPIGFSLVSGIGTPTQALTEFFVVPAARRGGAGRRLAAHVLACHPRPWSVAFQHDNPAAGHFWRAVFTEAFADGWTETEEPVPGKPDVSPDHWIRTT